MKVDKYDRQIRIWGPKGQKRLSQSKVAIIGCSGASIQAAKNLILPGVGKIDILDDGIIQISDLSTSFFYTHESVGKPRGQQASVNLLEMNPDVSGQFKNVSIQQILQSPTEHLGQYDLVICGNFPQDQNIKLSQQCWQLKIPIIFVTSVGFFFHVRSQKQEHIVESQNISGKKYYLMLHDPFAGLMNYVQQKQLTKIISQLKQQKEYYNEQKIKQLNKQFSKITYPVFLIQAYKQLKDTLKRIPKSQEVKQLLLQWRNIVPQDLDIRNGVNQALQRTFDLYQTTDNFLPDMTLFDIPSHIQITTQTHFIYIFLKAIKQFMSKHNGSLPQIVRLPDISTSTKDYIEFKSIYKSQHLVNKKELVEIIKKQVGQGYEVDEEILSEYINNIDALKIVRMKPFHQQLQHPDITGSCMQYLNSLKHLFASLKSYKLFQQQHHRPPNPSDFPQVLSIANNLFSTYGLTQLDEKFIKEVCKYQGKTLISYDSMAGAVVGQEAVKLLTGCFEPLNGGFYFDGIAAKGYTVKL